MHATAIVPRFHHAVGRVVFELNGAPAGRNQFLEVANGIALELDAVTLGIEHLSRSSGYTAMKDDPKPQRHGNEWAHTVVSKRPLIPPDKLRGGDRFVMALTFALMVDAAFAMVGMLSALAG